MGSGQSSASQKETKEKNKSTFSIGLDGPGDQSRPVKKQKKKKKKRVNGNLKSTDPSQEGKMAEASRQQQSEHQSTAGPVPLAALSAISPGLPQLSTLNTMPKAQPKSDDDSFSLQELDAILERMKAKYRPSPVLLSGKSEGVFEDIERNLVQCYSKHKDQPLECSKLIREYTAFVFEQRNRILRDAARKDSPIFT